MDGREPVLPSGRAVPWIAPKSFTDLGKIDGTKQWPETRHEEVGYVVSSKEPVPVRRQDTVEDFTLKR